MNALSNRAQAVRPVINGVHRSDDSKKNLGRADITGRLVAPDVLLARLQGEPIGRPAFGIVRNADETPWHVPFELVARGKISSVRSAETKRYAEALRVSECDVGAKFDRRLQQRQRQNVGGPIDQRERLIRLLHE